MKTDTSGYLVPAGLPKPVGWQLLLALPAPREKTRGGILLPDESKDTERLASVTAKVVAMGADAYRDADKFPGGPWCGIGDFVVIPRYAGTRIKIGGVEMRLLNDADILATTADPELLALVA